MGDGDGDGDSGSSVLLYAVLWLIQSARGWLEII